MGIFLRNYASKATQLLGNDPERVESLLSLTPAFQLDHIGIAIGAILIVSGMRFLLYKNWKEFAIATNRSNKQVDFSLPFFRKAFPGFTVVELFRLANGFVHSWNFRRAFISWRINSIVVSRLERRPYRWCCFWCVT